MNFLLHFSRGAVFFLLVSAPLLADSADADFDAANRAYTSGGYEESAKLFQQIILAHGYSAPVCFNLANAEAKAGHPGQALLNYERARFLAPGDSDIDHNLQLTRKQAGLQPNSYRWWQILLLSINWTVWLSLILGCLLLLILALFGIGSKKQGLRTASKAAFFICIPLALLFGFVELSAVGFASRIDGVIVASKEATLRLSPFETAEKVGAIPEGELVTVEKQYKDYIYIEARDHHYGWVDQKDIEPVIAGAFESKPSTTP